MNFMNNNNNNNFNYEDGGNLKINEQNNNPYEMGNQDNGSNQKGGDEDWDFQSIIYKINIKIIYYFKFK